MGCTCNKNAIELEKSNEMKEGRFETLGESPLQDSNYIIGNNEDEIGNSNNKLRAAPPSKFYEKEKDGTISFNENKYKNENHFHEITTDKFKEDEYNDLIKNYPKLEDGIKIEKRGPQENEEDKAIYYGEWDIDKNVRHGRGIQIMPDGSKYIGYWKNDKASGKGKLINPDGDIYEGDWLDDRPNGYGSYTQVDGTKYEGEWKDHKQNGKGKEIWPNGASYEGGFLDGKKSGKGKFIWADGSIYEGDFENNYINGEGTYIFADKRQYTGTWVNNRLNGKGIFIWPDGKKYEGEYKEDKKEGFGTYEWTNGRKYKGNWKKGKQDGEGEFYFPTEQAWKKGIWKKGKIIKWIESPTGFF